MFSRAEFSSDKMRWDDMNDVNARLYLDEMKPTCKVGSLVEATTASTAAIDKDAEDAEGEPDEASDSANQRRYKPRFAANIRRRRVHRRASTEYAISSQLIFHCSSFPPRGILARMSARIRACRARVDFGE